MFRVQTKIQVKQKPTSMRALGDLDDDEQTSFLSGAESGAGTARTRRTLRSRGMPTGRTYAVESVALDHPPPRTVRFEELGGDDDDDHEDDADVASWHGDVGSDGGAGGDADVDARAQRHHQGQQSKEPDGDIPHQVVEGITKLLKMHNSDELRFLGQVFGIPDGMPHAERLRTFHEVILTSELAYRKVLRHMWEGIVIEYWRGLGKNLKHYKFDLKHILWQWWLRERTEAAQPPQEWTPLFTPVEANPVRVVEEQVVDDPQVAEYVGKLKDAELLVKRAEHGLRFNQDLAHLQTYFAADGRLRAIERHGRAELLDLLHGARTKLEAANDANDELYTKIVETRENTLKCDQERLTQKRKFEEKREELRETREAFAALKADLGRQLKDERRNNKVLRAALIAADAEIDIIKTERIPKEQKARRKLLRKQKAVQQILDEKDAEIATWSDERARTRAMMANLIARSAHEDELIAVYFNSNAILAAECAELFAKGQERASELRNMALMLHAENETRYAMLKNPKAFKRVKPSKKKGKGKKKAGGRGRSKSKTAKGGRSSKSPAKKRRGKK